MRRLRVLVIDDSALMRRLLTELINSDPGVMVVGTATDPYDAREKIKVLHPDVLTLDVEMPKMDGLQFLKNLMRLRPMPVVMISSLTQRGADLTFRALELGAIDFVGKPRLNVEHAMQDYAEEIIRKIKAAALVDVGTLHPPLSPGAVDTALQQALVLGKPLRDEHRVIGIGASTGGTEAIRQLLQHARPGCPGIVIVQHIPVEFSASFAARLDRNSDLDVCEARAGQPVLPGHAYVAPGDRHLTLSEERGTLYCQLDDGERVNGHRPAVDRLFASIAQHAGARALGILLTGMGRDGAAGLLEMQRAGAATIAQDEASSQIWGMPRAAVELGAAAEVLGLANIATRLGPAAAIQESLAVADTV